EAFPEFTAVLGRAGRFPRTVLEDDFGLRNVSRERIAGSEEEERGVRETSIDDQLRISENLLIAPRLDPLIAFPPCPASPELGNRARIERGHGDAVRVLGRKIGSDLRVDAAQFVVRHGDDSISCALPIRSPVALCASRHPGRHVDDEDPPVLVVEFLDPYLPADPLIDARLRPPGLVGVGATADLSRPAVSDAAAEPAPPLTGPGNAVARPFFEACWPPRTPISCLPAPRGASGMLRVSCRPHLPLRHQLAEPVLDG